MIGQKAFATALPGFNDLGGSVTPVFFSRDIITIILNKNEQKKNNAGEVKKIKDFCTGHRGSSVRETIAENISL